MPLFGLKIDGKRTGAENDILWDEFGDMLSPLGPLGERNFFYHLTGLFNNVIKEPCLSLFSMVGGERFAKGWVWLC